MSIRTLYLRIPKGGALTSFSSVIRFIIGLFFRIVILMTVVLVAVWGLSPWGIHFGLEKPLGKMGLVLDEQSSIRLNPFSARLTINDLILNKGAIDPLKIKTATLSINVHQAIFGNMVFNDFTAEGLSLVITNSDGVLNVAGIDLSSPERAPANAPVPQGEKVEFGGSIILPDFTLSNSQIIYVGGGREEILYIKSLRVFDATFIAVSQHLKFELVGEYQKSKVLVHSKFDMNAGEGVIATKIDVQGLDVSFIKPYLSDASMQINSGLVSVRVNPVVTIEGGVINLSLGGLKLLLEGFQMYQKSGEVNIKDETKVERN